MIRNRDAASASNLSLDTLQAHELAAYRSGTWLGPPVSSEDLVDDTTNDHELIAELSARIRVAAEHLHVRHEADHRGAA